MHRHTRYTRAEKWRNGAVWWTRLATQRTWNRAHGGGRRGSRVRRDYERREPIVSIANGETACPSGTVARAILPSLARVDLKGRPASAESRRAQHTAPALSLSLFRWNTSCAPLSLPKHSRLLSLAFFHLPFPPAWSHHHRSTRLVLMPSFCRFASWTRERERERGREFESFWNKSWFFFLVGFNEGWFLNKYVCTQERECGCANTLILRNRRFERAFKGNFRGTGIEWSVLDSFGFGAVDQAWCF